MNTPTWVPDDEAQPVSRWDRMQVLSLYCVIILATAVAILFFILGMLWLVDAVVREVR